MQVARPLCTLACLLASIAVAPLAVADDADDIKDVVFDCTRAGIERGDLATFMKMWADDAKVVEGREEKPGKRDHTITRKQLEATCRLMFSFPVPDGGYKVTFESPRVEVKGDKAELRVMTTAQWDEDGEMDRQSEIYLLRRTADGWRVYENRYWMVEARQGDKTIDYDVKGWKLLDEIVAAAEKEDDLVKLVEALDDARRLTEAHNVAKKLTARDGATAEDWSRRGLQALSAGDADDATKAFKEALKLDPDADVPPIIRGAKKTPAME
jgi:ketosteroid isomerase-like protein